MYTAQWTVAMSGEIAKPSKQQQYDLNPGYVDWGSGVLTTDPPRPISQQSTFSN